MSQLYAEIPGPSKLSRRCYLIAKCNQKSISSLAVVTYNRDRIMLILFLMLITRIIILVITAHYTLDIPTIIAFLTSSSWKKPCTFFYVVRAQNLWWHLIERHQDLIYKITRVIYGYATQHWLQTIWTCPMKI